MAKIIILTGASGFLGRYVALEYSQAGYLVLGLGNTPWDETEWRKWGISEWTTGNVDLDTIQAFRRTPDVIVHCAGGGSVGHSYSNPCGDFSSTVGSLLPVMEFIRLCAPATRLVYPSSGAIYGQAERFPIKETDLPSPASPYGTNKLIAELLCQSYARHFGIKSTIVRFFSLYGPWLRKQLLWDACLRFSKGTSEFMGTGGEVRDWLHVEDAARLMRVSADHAAAPSLVVNGASGKGVAVRDILGTLRGAFPGIPPLVFTSQAKVGDPAAYVADCSRAMALGWGPAIDLAQGVQDYAAWFLRELQ